jgi:hypothetical protein
MPFSNTQVKVLAGTPSAGQVPCRRAGGGGFVPSLRKAS